MPAKPKRKRPKLQTGSLAGDTKAQRMVDRLRQQHALGEAALRAEKEGKSIADFAAEHPYSEHTIRKLKAFARHYSQADVDELCCSRRSRDQLPLHWGYVSVLLAIEGKHGVQTRKRFQRLALREGWTVPRLYREVRQRLGDSGHGRPMTEPQDVEDGLRMLAESLELLLRRCGKVKDLAKTNSDRFWLRQMSSLGEVPSRCARDSRHSVILSP